MVASPDPTVGEVLRDRLDTLVEAVHEADRMVGDQEPDGVHDLRVAMRRIRSLLVTFGPFLDHAETERLRWELRWVGRELGSLRDLEVVAGQLDALVRDERVELVMGAVVARIRDDGREARSEAVAHVAALRASGQYRQLLDDLDRLATEIPADIPGPDPDIDRARRRLRKDWRRLRRRIERADRTAGGAEAREVALHDVRKAAKRARYAAETLTMLFGSDADRMAEAARAVQQSLGDHRDTLLTTPVLRRLGVQAHLDGDNGFSFGRLHAREEARGASALDDYAVARRRVQRRRLRRWLA